MRIRRLDPTQADAEAVGFFLLKTFATEFMFGDVPTGPVNVDRAWPHVWNMLTNGAVWITEDGDGITGTIAMIPRRLWWTDFDYLGDGWFYVDSVQRRSRAAIMLLDAAAAHAEDEGMPFLIEVPNSDDFERKDRFFRRKGYARIGGYYLKENV